MFTEGHKLKVTIIPIPYFVSSVAEISCGKMAYLYIFSYYPNVKVQSSQNGYGEKALIVTTWKVTLNDG